MTKDNIINFEAILKEKRQKVKRPRVQAVANAKPQNNFDIVNRSLRNKEKSDETNVIEYPRPF